MNCLSDAVFENLLFVNVSVGGEGCAALFDSGAQKTVVSDRFLKRCNGVISTKTVSAGNNTGETMVCKLAVLKSLQIADQAVADLEVLVTDSAMLTMEDGQGRPFEAEMLLGYDVISRFRWGYDPIKRALDIAPSRDAGEKKTIAYNGFPTLSVTSGGKRFLAGLDTGHTETMVLERILPPDHGLASVADEIVGIGSAKQVNAFLVPRFSLIFEGKEVVLHDVTVQKCIYGAPNETDLLLGMDFLEGRPWEMDLSVGVFAFDPPNG